MIRRILSSACVVAALVGAYVAAVTDAAAQQNLRSITALPKPNVMNTPFHELLAELNAKYKDTMQIQYIGGPEATPVQEQMGALQRGVVDVFYGPSSYFDGQIPEVMAQNASNMTAVELRARGAHDLLNKAFNERANAQYLGYFGSGYTFHIYLKNEPKRTASGGVDLTGMKIRGATVYRPFYEKVGINMVLVQVNEMHSALERGVIEGIGWTTLAVTDAGWDKFLRYRIFPTFWQGDLAFVVNLNKWKALSQKERDLLQAAVIDAEKRGHELFLAKAKEQEDKLRAGGMKDIVLQGDDAKKYYAAAHESLWEQLGQKVAADRVAELRAKFVK
jgi:TRAP-type C4-dicarboxylate transport system substrate-binding protein